MAASPLVLSSDEVSRWLHVKKEWKRQENDLVKEYVFATYGEGVAFLIQITLLAEKKNHHPKMVLDYGKVRVFWSTHDAHGITSLDLAMAELCDQVGNQRA